MKRGEWPGLISKNRQEKRKEERIEMKMGLLKELPSLLVIESDEKRRHED